MSDLAIKFLDEQIKVAVTIIAGCEGDVADAEQALERAQVKRTKAHDHMTMLEQLQTNLIAKS
jgi:hypothetical protein